MVSFAWVQCSQTITALLIFPTALEPSSTLQQYRMKSGDYYRNSRRRQARGLIGVHNGKSIAALDMQLRVACIDDQIHAVRHLLEDGAGPFRIVCPVICPEISIHLHALHKLCDSVDQFTNRISKMFRILTTKRMR